MKKIHNNYNFEMKKDDGSNQKLPINTSKKCMNNKKVDYKLLTLLTTVSQYNPDIENVENYRYVYRNKLIENSDEIESLSKNKINTILRNCKRLCDIEESPVKAYKTEEGKIYYQIEYDINNKFVTIEGEILKFLVHTSNSSVIKTYCTLKWACRDGKRMLTRSWIANQIGLSDNRENLKLISEYTNILGCVGLIKKEHKITEDGKNHTYYTVNSYEKFKEIFNSRKNG